MRFFDKKEEVMDIQLTQHGKRLLASGSFRPKYYSFHDENIIYDTDYASVSEAQNDIETRIKKESIFLRTQYNHAGVETSLLAPERGTKLRNLNEVQFLQPISKRTSLGTQLAPQWSMKFYSGHLVSGSATVTGSNLVPIPITQLDFLQKYRVDAKIAETMTITDESAETARIQRAVFGDGSYLSVTDNFIIADIEEKNTPYEDQNFEVEVFIVENVNGTEKIKKLNFLRRPIYVENGLLLEEPIEIPKDFIPDERFVEYYLDIKVDHEITTEDLCSSISSLKARGLFIETDFECPEKIRPIFPVLYGSGVKEEDVEDCD